MHVYLLTTGRVIRPFDRPVGQMMLHGRPWSQLRAEILCHLGCKVEPIDDLRQVRRQPCLLVHDDLYFTYDAMARFLRSVSQAGLLASPAAAQQNEIVSGYTNAQAALATSELTEQFAPAFQGEPAEAAAGACCRTYGCYLLRCFDPQRPLAGQAAPLPIPHRLKRVRTRASRYFEPSGRFTVPVSPVFMVPLRHWASLVSANLLGMPGYFAYLARRRPGAVASLPLKMFWRAGSLRPSRLLGKLYWAGPRCRIHASAHVEAAVIGRRVRIGPNAVLRGCVIGDHSQVGPGAVLEGCTLGQGVTVDGGVMLRGCVAEDEASLGSFFTQLSLIGRGGVLCPESGIFDFQFTGSVRVDVDGQMVPSGARLLGGCLGERAFLGPGVRLLCGQQVPNDCVLVPNPRELVRDVEHGLPPGVVRLDQQGRRHRPRRLRQAS